MDGSPSERDNVLPAWRRWAGNFYVQLGAAYLVVAAVVYLRAFPFRSKYPGMIWLNPLHAYWDPDITWWAVPAVAAAGAGTYLIVRATRAGEIWPLAVGALLNIVGVGLGAPFGRNFPLNWLKRFLADARLFFDAPNVFVNYVEITKGVGVHCCTRPGLLYWLLGSLDRLFSGNVYVIGFVFIAVAAACVPILYVGARALVKKEESAAAAALFACAPSLLVFGSGPDGLNCLLGGAVMACGLKAASDERPWLWTAAGGILLAFGVTTSYALPVMVVFLAAFMLAAAVSGRGRLRYLARWLVIVFIATAALAIFQVITGYDHVAVFKRAYWTSQELTMSGDNVFKFIGRAIGRGGLNLPKPGERPYWIYVFGNLYSTFFIMGVPAAVLYTREMFRIFSRKQVRRSFYGAAMIGFLVVFLANNSSGLVLGEVERIWLFLIPAFLVPGGVELMRLGRKEGGKALTATVFILTITQSLVYNIVLGTPF
ncbi:MAG: glycosyltransferase family 39 protein [bacterium]